MNVFIIQKAGLEEVFEFHQFYQKLLLFCKIVYNVKINAVHSIIQYLKFCPFVSTLILSIFRFCFFCCLVRSFTPPDLLCYSFCFFFLFIYFLLRYFYSLFDLFISSLLLSSFSTCFSVFFIPLLSISSCM